MAWAKSGLNAFPNFAVTARLKVVFNLAAVGKHQSVPHRAAFLTGARVAGRSDDFGPSSVSAFLRGPRLNFVRFQRLLRSNRHLGAVLVVQIFAHLLANEITTYSTSSDNQFSHATAGSVAEHAADHRTRDRTDRASNFLFALSRASGGPKNHRDQTHSTRDFN